MYTWLEASWQQLNQARLQDRLPHALLIRGQDGVGKQALALHTAGALLCEQPDAEGNACGRCAACGWLQAGTHPDLIRLEPAEAGKAIKVDQIRELGSALAMTSHGGRHKVAIIRPAEAMNVNAANSLLKTLEEPAADTLLLLLSAAPGRLPATVRSRCQQLAVATPDTAQARQWLQSEGLGADTVLRYLELADGAPLRAREMAEADSAALRDQRLEQLAAVGSGRMDPLQAAKDWQGDAQRQSLEWWRLWLQALIRWKLADRPPQEPDVVQKLQQFTERVDCCQMFDLSDRIAKALNSMGSGLNQQLVLEDLLISWARLPKRTGARTRAGNR